MAAKTAGQHRPTRASGTVVRVGASGSPKMAVTPVWSATRSGSQCTVTVAVPLCTRGRVSGPSAPAAIASTERIASIASLVRITGMAPSIVLAGKLNRMSIHTPAIGTLNTTWSPSAVRRAPVDEWVACGSSGPSCTCQSPGSAMRCTGLVATRPAHNTSGASSTVASGPRTSRRPCRRAVTGVGVAPGRARRRSRPARNGRAARRPARRAGRYRPPPTYPG